MQDSRVEGSQDRGCLSVSEGSEGLHSGSGMSWQFCGLLGLRGCRVSSVSGDSPRFRVWELSSQVKKQKKEASFAASLRNDEACNAALDMYPKQPRSGLPWALVHWVTLRCSCHCHTLSRSCHLRVQAHCAASFRRRALPSAHHFFVMALGKCGAGILIKKEKESSKATRHPECASSYMFNFPAWRYFSV